MEITQNKNKVLLNYGLLLIDLFCAIVSYAIALYIRFGSVQKMQDNVNIITIFCILLFLVLYSSLFETSRNFNDRGYYVELIIILKRTTVMAILWGCSLFLIKLEEDYSRLVFGYFVIIDISMCYILHLVFKKYIKVYYKNIRHKTKVMVISDMKNITDVLRALDEKGDVTYEISYAVVWDRKILQKEIEGIPIIADSENILNVTLQIPLDEVLIYLPAEDKEKIQSLIAEFEIMGIICHYGIDVVELNVKTRILEEFGGFTVITYALNQLDYKHKMIKRAMDIFGSLIGIIITCLIYPFVALAIKLDSSGPIMFKQIRIGKNGRRFKMYKFRSMYVDAEMRKRELLDDNEVEGLMFKVEKDPRITRVGKFIRKFSIDELPQFFNVLKGDMSLVGTRPPTVDEFEQYNAYYRRRLCITPGLTGLWQVNGRSNINNFEDVVKFDLHYIDYWSISLDIKILLQTLLVVLFRRGAK